MNIIEKYRNKLLKFLFPFIDHFYPIISLVLIVAALSVPKTFWQIEVVLFWLWLVNSEIYWKGVMERDYLPIQSGNNLFYHIYRFIDLASFFLLLIFLAVMVIPGLLVLKRIFLVMFVIAVILRTIGNRKYRLKKPKE